MAAQDPARARPPIELRVAALDDFDAIERLMRVSAGALSAGFYDARQTASVVTHIAQVDAMLIDDGSYYVTRSWPIVACGGWSYRDKLFTGTPDSGTVRLLDPATEPARIRAMFVHPEHARRGLGRMILERSERDAAARGFTRAELMATLPGVPLYTACGYVALEDTELRLPDGVCVGAVRMGKPLAP